MFERHDSLLDRVSAVAKRYRATRLWWSLGLIAAIASIAGYGLRHQVIAGNLTASDAIITLLSATLIAVVASFLMIRMSYRNPRLIATKIEHRFPGLQQRLLTALCQQPAGGQPLGFLQRRVISDAYQHSITHRWTETVPRAQAILSRISGVVSLAIFAVVVTLLGITTPQQKATARSQRFISPEIVIEPGNTEVERSSGLVISARFPNKAMLPKNLDLVTSDPQGAEQRFPMSQSLDDPILSGYVPSIDKPFRYQVASRDWQSETYQVDVFEFPRLVRADAVITYPSYTKLEPKRIEDTVRVSAVEGSIIQWQLFLNKSVSTISIRAGDGERIEPSASDPDSYQLQFAATVTQTTRYSIELKDDKGRTNKVPITLDVRMIPNRVPELKLVRSGDFVASPIEEVAFAATVQDDFEIIRAGVSYQLADGRSEEVTLSENTSRGVKMPLEFLLELESLQAKPDQLVSYHFWAEDHSPDGEVRRTESDLYFGEIRPFEEIFRQGEAPPGGQSQPQSRGSQQTEELLELQKQIVSATWKIARNPASAEKIETFDSDIRLLEESQQQAIDQAESLAAEANEAEAKALLGTLVEQMNQALIDLHKAGVSMSKKPLDDALVDEQAAYQTLLQMRAREIQVSRSRQQQGQSSSASSQRRQQQLDALELENDENRYETQSQASEQNAQDPNREDRQILNRLKELAQRQEDINTQLAQLQSALQQAKDEEEKEEIRRQLKRLREQQQEMLREADELAERMQQPENNESMSEQAEQLSQTRENMRRSSEALEQNNAAEALAAGTRVERELDEMSEEFRKRAAGEFDEAVRDLRSQARELEQKQQELGQQMEQLTAGNEPGLRSGGDREAIQESLKQQQARMEELLEKVQSTVEEAEPAEPLLAQDLYETYRKTQQNQVGQRMTDTGELLRRGLDPQAQQVQRATQAATTELRKDLEKAADSVLGNEAKALQRALGELERLDQAVQDELGSREESPANQNPEGANQKLGDGNPSDPSDPSDPSQPRTVESSGQPSPSGQGRASDPQSDAAKPGNSQLGLSQGGRIDQVGSGREAIASPIAGEGFREFSDTLRDVEEMVGDPQLRSEAAAIRDRARQMRMDLKRHSKQPQWELVESMIAKPLRELKMKVTEELLRRSAERTDPVPIDRDPVPQEFSGAVQRYYESLGSGL